MLVNLHKQSPFGAKAIWTQFGSRLCNVMSHGSLSEDLLEVLWYNEAQWLGKNSVSQLSKKISFWGQYGPNLVQNYTNLYQYLVTL